MSTFQPFANNNQSVGLADLTLENQGDQVNLYGSATFTIDKDSLALAKSLQNTLTEIVSYLESHNAANVDKVDVIKTQQDNVSEVANPFL